MRNRHFLLLLQLNSSSNLLLVAILLQFEIAPFDRREDGTLRQVVRFVHVHIQSTRDTRSCTSVESVDARLEAEPGED